jgi:hypothetical protein
MTLQHGGCAALRRAIAAIVFVFLAYGSFASDFRKTSWLMSKNQVLASEDGTLVTERNIAGQQEVIYRAQFEGYLGSVTYMLENDRLLAATYNYQRDDTRQVYSHMKESLTREFGKPSLQTDSLAVWRSERTEIALTFRAEKTCYVAFWEKGYFARINKLTTAQ